MNSSPPPALPFDVAGIRLDGPGPLARQLVEQLRQRMLQGELPAGARMPATRDLAAALGVSRNTVVRAFEHLLDEGLISSRVGDGSYVTPPLAQMAASPTLPPSRASAPAALASSCRARAVALAERPCRTPAKAMPAATRSARAPAIARPRTG